MSSNFDFIRAEWPETYADCVRAEDYLVSDPRSACFYGRRTIERVVGHLYDVAGLPLPYRDDLAARIGDPAFKNPVGVAHATTLNLIRKLGNLAVHETRTIPPRAALDALRELHHDIVWAAFRFSTRPQDVPTGAQFDSTLAKRAAPLSREDVVRLARSCPARPRHDIFSTRTSTGSS